jgi:hypothetical protein
MGASSSLKSFEVTISVAAVVLATSGCSTGCQDIVAEYITALPYAKSCDPAASGPCSVQLPVAESLEDSNGNTTPEKLAGNCTTSFNPAHSAELQSLYSQYQSAGCPLGNTPICGDSSTAQCSLLSAGQGGDGGYTCVDGFGTP